MRRLHSGGIIPTFDGGAAFVSIPTMEEVRQEEAKRIARQQAAAATLKAIGTLAGEISAAGTSSPSSPAPFYYNWW